MRNPAALIPLLSLGLMLTPPVQAQSQAPALFTPPPLTGESPERALECLALAISYEAGIEPLAGQEAVAQVILNRVMHPAYPDTVCGVVWQGSTRRTGCQFSFTCDGSMQRHPRSAAALEPHRAVAYRVLSGASFDQVSGATHYHADYVSPYWAPSLVRVRKIATHIFYRNPGPPLRAQGGQAVQFAAPERAASPPPVQTPAPGSDGVFAPWGLAVGQVRR
jgi:spore germination cell wall hydrolase CwlJ-like protein